MKKETKNFVGGLLLGIASMFLISVIFVNNSTKKNGKVSIKQDPPSEIDIEIKKTEAAYDSLERLHDKAFNNWTESHRLLSELVMISAPLDRNKRLEALSNRRRYVYQQVDSMYKSKQKLEKEKDFQFQKLRVLRDSRVSKILKE